MEATPRCALLEYVMICLVGLGLAAVAYASGQMPILVSQLEFTTHDACVRALEAAYVEDEKLNTPRTFKSDSTTREVNVVSRGVERIGPNIARYEVTIWYHIGGLRNDLQPPQIEVRHSYEHPFRQCEGKTMTISGNRGYSLSTFEPLIEPKPPKL